MILVTTSKITNSEFLIISWAIISDDKWMDINTPYLNCPNELLIKDYFNQIFMYL